MSVTSIPERIKLNIWLRAGGRCQYRGCNEELWKDKLTLAKMNRAYLAHIVADVPNGPRGNPIDSPLLKADPSNIMLLCDTHHRLIDIVQEKEHPVDLLIGYKREHEDRIQRQTAIHSTQRTHLLLLGTKIGERRGKVSIEEAQQTVLPERYPANEMGIQIDLGSLAVNESDGEFWTVACKHIERILNNLRDDGIGLMGEPVNHLSIFALAPIPILIFFGKKLGDIISADIYQHHRSTNTWQWLTLPDEDFDYIISYPQEVKVCEKVVINISLSGRIQEDEIQEVLGASMPTYTITIKQPDVSFLKAKEQLELFRVTWRRLLSKIRETNGRKCEIYLFAAVPAPFAVEVGRSLLPHVDPTIHIYNKSKPNGFTFTFSI